LPAVDCAAQVVHLQAYIVICVQIDDIQVVRVKVEGFWKWNKKVRKAGLVVKIAVFIPLQSLVTLFSLFRENFFMHSHLSAPCEYDQLLAGQL
jgi:hypothetical protein